MNNEAKELIVSSLSNEALAEFIDPDEGDLFNVSPMPLNESDYMGFHILAEIAKRLRNHSLEQ